MGCRLLDVPERNPGIKGGSDESMTKRMGAYRLGDPGSAGHPAHDPRGTVPVQPTAIRSQEDRAFAALARRQVDRPRRARQGRNGGNLSALALDGQGAVPTLLPEPLDVRTNGFRYPQPVEREQRDQRML